jgi:hypothetical protein
MIVELQSKIEHCREKFVGYWLRARGGRPQAIVGFNLRERTARDVGQGLPVLGIDA